MLEFVIFKNFIIAIGLGALIGLEREMEQQSLRVQDFAGLRTMILISLLGAVIGYISNEVIGSYTLIFIAFISVAAISVAAYIGLAKVQKKVGATTEITSLLAFTLGAMCTIGLSSIAVILTVIIAMFLAFKGKLHGFAKKIKISELLAAIEFAIVSIVVLPFLPNKNFSPLDIPYISKVITSIPFISKEFLAQLDVFNPYRIWLMVVFISGLSFIGYILIKWIGEKRGLGLTGFLGGLVSSTAVTSTMSAESKGHVRLVNSFVFATLIASSVMFIRIIIEVLVVNNSLLPYVFLPMFIMGAAGFISAFIFWKKKSQESEGFGLKSPFALRPAIKFGLFFGFVLFIAKLASILFGNTGIYIASILSGLVDVDAITLTMSNLAASGDISSGTAVLAITLAASSNMIVKGGIAYLFGTREFAKKVAIAFAVILTLGILAAALL